MTMSDKLQAPEAKLPRPDHDLNPIGNPVSNPVSNPAGDPHRDLDPQETAEWRDAFAAVLAGSGPARGRFLLDQLAQLACHPSVGWEPPRGTPYANSIPVERQPVYPGDLAIEERLGPRAASLPTPTSTPTSS